MPKNTKNTLDENMKNKTNLAVSVLCLAVATLFVISNVSYETLILGFFAGINLMIAIMENLPNN